VKPKADGLRPVRNGPGHARAALSRWTLRRAADALRRADIEPTTPGQPGTSYSFRAGRFAEARLTRGRAKRFPVIPAELASARLRSDYGAAAQSFERALRPALRILTHHVFMTGRPATSKAMDLMAGRRLLNPAGGGSALLEE
jgi:hypothetical protein